MVGEVLCEQSNGSDMKPFIPACYPERLRKTVCIVWNNKTNVTLLFVCRSHVFSVLLLLCISIAA